LLFHSFYYIKNYFSGSGFEVRGRRENLEPLTSNPEPLSIVDINKRAIEAKKKEMKR